MRRDVVEHAEDAIVLYGTVARLVLPPDEQMEAAAKSDELPLSIRAAAMRVREKAGGLSAPGNDQISELVEAADAFVAAARRWRDGSAQSSTLKETHAWTFGHALSPDHPPYETQYGEDPVFRQPQRLANVRGFYRAFGVEVPEGAHERADHLGVEAEFVALLTAREATAEANGDTEHAAVCSRALERFLREHLGPVLPTFRRLLTKHAGEGFYSAVARVAEAICAWDCERRGVAVAVDERARLVKVLEPDPDFIEYEERFHS